MAQEYDNNNRGSIWKNEKKETETHPDFTGSATINGVEMWVSAWKRKEGAKDKSPALSFTFKAKDGAPQSNSKQQAKANNDFDETEDIPF